MKISPDHFLDSAKRDIIAGGSLMNIRRVLVIHFTGGATAASSVEAMRERNVSAHVVVDRDGSIIQCRGFNQVASHAGRSRWVDPHTGIRYDGINACGIGIEIANAGNDPGALSWARQQPGFASMKSNHRNGGPWVEWEKYPDAQLKSVFALSQLLVATYKLDDITGHDCIAPERKDDPGPAFPMLELRAACGFSGLPVVHQP
jgi:N-acetylmuramoyl-L-alanine amidase